MGMQDYQRLVYERVLQVISAADLPSTQRELLTACVDRAFGHIIKDPISNPLTMLYLIARSNGASDPYLEARALDTALAEWVGVFCFLHICALDLFDDVQDDDLGGKPHEAAGPALACNDAYMLLCLGLDGLRRALEHEPDAERRMEYLRAFNRYSVLAGAGQHRDLKGTGGATTPADVLAMQLAKTSTVALVAECGALLAQLDPARRANYRLLGERLTLMVQIVDDLRDIFGKEHSPDLSTDKLTYPIACLLDHGGPPVRKRFEALRKDLPGSLRDIRQMMYEEGAVEQCADTLERLREDVHQTLADVSRAAPASGPVHRLLLQIVDGLVSPIYSPPTLTTSAELWAPSGGFHDLVRAEQARFAERVSCLGDRPTLRPWIASQYLFTPSGTPSGSTPSGSTPSGSVIYYPDLDGWPEEILPYYMGLLGGMSGREVLSVVRGQLPAVMAHEMFHAQRHAAGLLTEDAWYEEYVANRLSVGYLRKYEPAVLAQVVASAERVVQAHRGALVGAGEAILRRCSAFSSDAPPGYGVDDLRAGIVHLEMVRRLAADAPDLDTDLIEFLRRAPIGSNAQAA